MAEFDKIGKIGRIGELPKICRMYPDSCDTCKIRFKCLTSGDVVVVGLEDD